MKNRLLFFFLFLVFSGLTLKTYGQVDTIAPNGDSIKIWDAEKRFLSLPSFTTFNDNYFITGTSLKEWPNKNNSDIKYQISFKQLLYRKHLIFKSYPFVSYTQKAFWDIYKNSKPFAEINFNPALGLIRPYNSKSGLQGYATFMLEHESNGRDSSQSRSWNFLSFGFRQSLSTRLQVNAKIWLPFAYKEDNPDLIHYIGYGQLGASYIFIPDRWYADVLIKKGNQWNWKGSVLTQLYYKPFKKGNQFIGIQWYQGYAENLIDYQQHTSMIRIGLIIKPNMLDFFY